MKRVILVLAAAIAISMLAGGTALANFGPHGGYVDDTDACAGCHRAHTSFATLGWTDNQGAQHASALLVSNASTMEEFCYACHGDSAPGASTNVQAGVFDSGPSDDALSANPEYAPYLTESTYLAPLNGGGFTSFKGNPITSAHSMEASNVPLWGAITGVNGSPSNWGKFRCTDCHDPHGSSNYRLLKDNVNGGTAEGGYLPGDVPDPWVISNEVQYPTGGWDKGTTGMGQMTNYRPNYTTPKYAHSSNTEGISGWCAGCHQAYMERNDVTAAGGPKTYDYGSWEGYDANGNDNYADPGDGLVGAESRHRHPVGNVTVAQGQGAGRGLMVELTLDTNLPLEMPTGLAHDPADGMPSWDERGYLNCLTCHFAHGSDATMTGWAVSELRPSSTGMAPVRVDPSTTASDGVNPAFSSSILRVPNRGVCERCHNK